MRELAYTFHADWDTKTIGDIACHVGSGATPTGGSSVYSKTGITFIRSQNVTFKGLLLDDVAFIETSIHQQMARSEIFPHDVLLNITGASIGRCCFVPHDFGLANVNQHVCAIRLPKPSHEDAVFLAGVLASHIGQAQIDRLNAGGNREGLNYQQVRSFVVPWPRPEERKRIAAILEAVDEAIAKTEAVIAKLKHLRTGLLHDLLTRGLDAHGQLRDPIAHPEQFADSPLGRIPLEWEVVQLGLRSLFVTSGSRGWAAYYSKDGPMFLRIGNVTREHINLRLDDVVRVRPPAGSEGARTRVEPGDILISITADLGIIGVIPEQFEEAYVNQHLALVRPASGVVPRWLGRFLAFGPTAKQFQMLNDSGAKAGLNLPAVQSLLVAVPHRDEQLASSRVLDTIDEQIDEQLQLARKLAQLKSGLMADLLTGRVRVPEGVAVAP